MSINFAKLIVAGVLAVVLVVALLIDGGARDWAAPFLGLLVGYVVGNAQVTNNVPIIKR